MKSVFLFLQLPASPPAIGLQPAVCPAGPALRLSGPHISYQPSSVHISVFQSVQNLDWRICLRLVRVYGVCGFQVYPGPNYWKFRGLPPPSLPFPNLGSELTAHV